MAVAADEVSVVGAVVAVASWFAAVAVATVEAMATVAGAAAGCVFNPIYGRVVCY